MAGGYDGVTNPPSVPHLGMRRLDEGLDTGLRAAKDEGMDVVRTLIGVDRLGFMTWRMT